MSWAALKVATTSLPRRSRPFAEAFCRGLFLAVQPGMVADEHAAGQALPPPARPARLQPPAAVLFHQLAHAGHVAAAQERGLAEVQSHAVGAQVQALPKRFLEGLSEASKGSSFRRAA